MAGRAMKDMTNGSPMKLILGFLVPMLFGLLFQQFYSMMDTIIVGKYLGVQALASVGSTGSINFMIIGFCMGICSGFAIPVAQKFGEKNETALRRYVANSGYLAAGFAAVMTVTVCLLCKTILGLMRTPQDIIDGAYAYIFVIFLGIPVTYLYNMLSGIIRSMGDSTTPLYFLLISSVMNVALDLFTITVLNMGVAGAAWATVISQGVSGVLCLLYMKKKFTILKMEKDEWKPDVNAMRTLCGMGIPMGLQYSITAIGSVVIQTAVNTLGSVAVASVTAGSKVSMFFCCPFDAMGATMATYGGQNVGARRLDRIGQGMKDCVILGGSLRFRSFRGFVSVQRYHCPDVCGRRGDPDPGQCQTVSFDQLRHVFSAGACKYRPVYDPGAWVFQACHCGWGMRDGGQIPGSFCLVPVFGYSGACLANPAALDRGGPVF